MGCLGKPLCGVQEGMAEKSFLLEMILYQVNLVYLIQEANTNVSLTRAGWDRIGITELSWVEAGLCIFLSYTIPNQIKCERNCQSVILSWTCENRVVLSRRESVWFKDDHGSSDFEIHVCDYSASTAVKAGTVPSVKREALVYPHPRHW